jgi:hypothetical protein
MVGVGRRQLPPGDDMDVDAGRASFPQDPPHDGSSTGEFLPAAAFARADYDLGDLVLLGKGDDGPSRVVGVDLVPPGPRRRP